jgi:hypothetical protein
MRETPLGNIPGQTARPWLQQAFRQLLVRTPEADELNVLEDLFDTQSELLRNDTAQIDRILQAGDLGPRDLDPSQKLDRPQWAALATVLQVLLTLDETLTRE